MNISEGRRRSVLDAIAAVAGPDLLDLHADPHHNRAVLTLVGEEAPRAVAAATIERLDLRAHDGVHPRLGVVDVVPFVPLGGAGIDDAVAARDRCAAWIAAELGVPVFLYGPERTLPEVRRGAFRTLEPDHGPDVPHPTAGAAAVGARPLLVAWNAYLADPDLERARAIAAAIRGPHLRALGLQVGHEVQVSLNLVAPDRLGPAEAWDLIAGHAAVARAELVGLVPRSVLDRTPEERWSQLDLATERTVEVRVAPAEDPSDPSGRAG